MENNKIMNERSLNVVKRNEIVQKARYKLDIVQQKTIMYLISKIDPIKDLVFQDITVSLKDLCEIMGIDGGSGKNIKNLKDAMQKLSDKSMWVELGEANKSITLIRWLDRVTITPGESTVTVRFDERMAPFLLQIKERFIQYELVNVLAMKSQYSIRLYELIKSHEAQGQWEVTLEDLRKLLYIEDNKYTDWRNFSQRILQTSILEICNFTDLLVAYSPKRKDRKIYSIVFTMCECTIGENGCREYFRRKLNRDTILDNHPAEIVERVVPTSEEIRELRKIEYTAKQRQILHEKFQRQIDLNSLESN